MSCAIWDHRGRWVRFHSLSESRRYPAGEGDFRELLRRHNTVIEELLDEHAESPDRSVLIIVSSWSAAARPPRKVREVPGAGVASEHWQSLQVDDDELWTHLYVAEMAWREGCLDGLLRLVATDEVSGVVVAIPTLQWLYHPYDGGADVVVPTHEERENLAQRHSEWLPVGPGDL